MKSSLSQLWTSEGLVDRRVYALIGFFGFAIKHNLDRLVATAGFHRPWSLFNYWVPVRDVARITQVPSNEAVFLATMVAISLPFIWIGVVLTIKRLRSAGLPSELVALFFVPFLNLLFLVLLCLVPEREERERTSPHPENSLLSRVIPQNQFGSAAVALLITVPIGCGTALFGANVLAHYGWGMFVALPFVVGFVSATLYGVHRPPALASCIGVACLSVTLLGGALLALAVEGLFCLLMALPLALPLAAFGGICAYFVQKLRWNQARGPALLSALLLFSPSVQYLEHLTSKPEPIFTVQTYLDVQAPPERVWTEVIAFTQIPAPTEWMFRAGIAYPIRAEMIGTGIGAERHCVFSTGAFVEPIQIWNPPHQLKFTVTSNPAPMEEWTFYKHIDPPHLHGFLVSEGGQFLLTPLPNGGTRLEGTTWYKHGLWPSQYWKLWSDTIIHRIHLRVLRHIRDEAERKRPA